MYRTCIFCQQDLGQNEAIETFPVGRRLAFDSARGRLWVVCRRCERWNLTPLEIRWEAVEACERAFRDTRLRVSTDNIGLARLAEGLELVRIGTPLRPEIAAWRYGDQFGRRRRRNIALVGTAVAAGAGVMAGAVAVGIAGSMGGLWQLPHAIWMGRTAARVKTPDGRVLQVRGQDLQKVKLHPGPDGDPQLVVPHRRGSPEIVQGEELARVAGILLPRINRAGGNRRAVATAVDRLQHYGTAGEFVQHVAETVRAESRRPDKPRALHGLPTPTRLAFEMVLHEEQERRAVEGELRLLERAWREAEEIAGIADNLFVPDSATSRLDALRHQGHGRDGQIAG